MTIVEAAMDGDEAEGRGARGRSEHARSGGRPVVVGVRGAHRRIALEDPRDEIDRLVDDAFAGIPDEPPGRADAILAAGGVALVGLAIVGAGAACLALGVLILALGVARPMEHVVRGASRRRRSWLAHAVEGAGDDRR